VKLLKRKLRKEEKKLILLILISSVFSILLILVSYLYLSFLPRISFLIYFLAVFLLASPIIIWRYTQYIKKKQIEENFPAFLRDFVEAVRGGLTIPEAIKYVSKNDYKALSPYVKKMSAQLEWGIPLDQVFTNFMKEVNSKLIARIISSVIETHKFGGKLVETFESLSKAALEIERLRLERKMFLQGQMITGYLIFFVFLGIVVGLEKFLIPSLTQGGFPGQGNLELVASEFKILFRNLILIQAGFAGLMVGKMSEGAIIAGIKHSLIMITIGMLVIFLAL